MRPLVAILTSVGAASFVLVTGQELPAVVASHFDAAGTPDRHMPRDTFVGLMALLASVLPLVLWWLLVLQARAGSSKIAHAAHWFAPERRQATVAWLEGHANAFAAALAGFMAYVFWLSVWAHRQEPVQLPVLPFWIGLAVFLGFTALWVYAQHRRFSQPI